MLRFFTCQKRSDPGLGIRETLLLILIHATFSEPWFWFKGSFSKFKDITS
jgi:hypothetical protein